MTRARLLVSSLLLCGQVLSVTTARAENWQDLEREADVAIRRQPPDYRLAVEKLRLALKDFGGPPSLLYRIGQYALLNGDCAEARQACTEYLGYARGDYAKRAQQCIADATARCDQHVPPPPPPCTESRCEACPPVPSTSLPPRESRPIDPQDYYRCQQLDPTRARGCLAQLLTQPQFPPWNAAVMSDILIRLTQEGRSGSRDLTMPVARRNTGLWSAGLTLWLSAMVPAMVYGPINVRDYKGYGLDDVYYSLMIPVVGPFISGIWMPQRAGDPKDAWINYSLPWILADGLSQVAGLTMFITGLQRRRTPSAGAGYAAKTNFLVRPQASVAGGGLAISGSF